MSKFQKNYLFIRDSIGLRLVWLGKYTLILIYILLYPDYSTVSQHQNNNHNNNDQQRKQSTWSLFRRSRFFVTVVIVLSFTLLIAIPDLLIVFHLFLKIRLNKYLLLVNYIAGSINDLLHCFVYVFAKDKVRRRLGRALDFAWRSKRRDGRRNQRRLTEFTEMASVGVGQIAKFMESKFTIARWTMLCRSKKNK